MKGLYAQYDKSDGLYAGKTEVKNPSDVYKSNKDNQTYFWELITTDLSDTINVDIPKKAKTWMGAMDMDNELNYCEKCGDYFTDEEMYHIGDGTDWTVSECKNCASD